MPNWCYTNVCFRGTPENINRLYADINKSIEYMKENNYRYTNLSYFFSLNNFNVENYLNRYTKRLYLGTSKVYGHHMWFPIRISFRGSFVDYQYPIINNIDGSCTLDAALEMAWNMDYEVLHLISLMYNVEFSAYSEEPGMVIFSKCRNCDLPDYNFNVVVTPDYEQAEEAMNKNRELELYQTPFNTTDPEYKKFIKTLNQNKVEYCTDKVEEIDHTELAVYGVYYDPITGVTYDKENDNVC